MEVNKNLQLAIVRRILILSVLCIIVIIQNLAGIIHQGCLPTNKEDICWELLLINISEIVLIILYYSQIDTDTSEHFTGDVWNKFVSGYVMQSYKWKMQAMWIVIVALSVLLISYAVFNESWLFYAIMGVLTVFFALIGYDAYRLFKSALRAVES